MTPNRHIPVAITAAILAISGSLILGIVQAQSATPGVDPTYVKECGACHIPFPARYLPARSWDTIVTNLNKHFGEDASLTPKAAAAIKTYLDINAADAPGGSSRVMMNVSPSQTPLRISEMPFWTRIHAKAIERQSFNQPKVKSKANCTACHRGAANGQFED